MTYNERKQIADWLAAKEDEIMQTKGRDYSDKTDSLANFKRNAEFLGLTKYQVWAVYAGKHIDAIFNAIKASPAGPVVKSEPLRMRILDVRVYLTILLGLLVEDEIESRNTLTEPL